VIALDLRGISSFTDFFVIASGTSEPHLRALAGELEGRLQSEHDVTALAVDGFPTSQWIVADFRGVVVHLFSKDKRLYYGLEDLWSDAPRLPLGGEK